MHDRTLIRGKGRIGQEAPSLQRHPLVPDSTFGTWDFKWPLRTKIRVAFQLPRVFARERMTDLTAFYKAANTVRSWAELWGRERFEWLGLTDANPSAPGFIFAASEDPDTDRSTRLVGASTAAFGATMYDVLVSLDHLSTDGRPHSRGSRFTLPNAELGTYNRRADYGEPTVRVGPLGAWPGTIEEYFAETDRPGPLQKLGRFHVAHEFGHVLGLVHAHQVETWRKANDLVLPPIGDTTDPASLTGRLMTVLTGQLCLDKELVAAEARELVEAHIHAVWPGNSRHSDWRNDQLPTTPSRRWSATTVPFLHCLLSRTPADATCPQCVDELPAGPTAQDIEALHQLYE